MTKQEALDRIKELEKFIEETDKKKEWVWKPKEDEYCWFVGAYETYSQLWFGSLSDLGMLKQGNCFKTEEEAEQHLDWLKARATLIRDAQRKNEGWEPCWDTEDDDEVNSYVYYDYEDGELVATSTGNVHLGSIYFKSEELVEQSIEEHEEEWLVYLGVKKNRGMDSNKTSRVCEG